MAKSGIHGSRSTFYGGHDFIFEYCCNFCEGEGNVKEAVGYCSDCSAYLCSDCFKSHLKPIPLRHHQLLDQYQMPKDKQQNRLSFTLKCGSEYVYENCCDLCEGEGQQKEVVGYCSNCCEYLCTDCFRHHTRPKPMRHHVLLDQHQMPKDQHNTVTDSLSSTLQGGSDYVYEYCCGLCEETGEQKEAVGYCSNCCEYLCTYCFRHHTRPKPLRHHVLLDQHRMPKLQQGRYMKKTCAYPIMDVRVGNSLLSNFITGCVVLHRDKLVIVDSGVNKVKLIELARVVSVLKLAGEILDITKVNSSQVAITCQNKQAICFVNVGLELKVDREIQVKGQCRGIARINDSLVVSYTRPVKVDIINMKGEVLRAVVTEDKCKELFTYPWYIAVSKDKHRIYISDRDRNNVTSIDLAGMVQATYTDDKLSKPRGLTVDTAGTVYVCGGDSDNILQLTPDLTAGRHLLKRSDGVEDPKYICYCLTTDRLYVGMMRSGVLKVFQMK